MFGLLYLLVNGTEKFKSRLCSYLIFGFLQFHFISAKIYILQIYLLSTGMFVLLYLVVNGTEKFKSRLCPYLIFDFMQFYFISAGVYILHKCLLNTGMFVLLYLVVNGTSFFFFDERIMSFLPLGVFFSTVFWMYYTWIQEQIDT